MTQTDLAASADYADALLVTRRAKGLVSGLILFVLATELSLFFCLRYYKPLPWGNTPAEQHTRAVIEYLVGMLDIGGLILPALLTVIIYLILKVQLVGRLIGTGRMTAAFLWSVLLMMLLFPWQAVLNNPAINPDVVADSLGMKIPGVIFTWAEVSHPTLGATFGLTQPKPDTFKLVLDWARYVGFPLLSILILTIIHFKTQRGLRQSLGEDKIMIETNAGV